jgi:hypothetical protein
MARNLSKDLKRLVAGLCAVLIVGGAVPLQPLVNLGGTFKAAADSVGNVSYQPVEYTYTSTGINYGLILKVGNSLNTAGTSGNFKFMTKTKVQYTNIDSASYIGGDSGSSIMTGISRITPNSNGTFTATFSNGTTATLYPEKGCTFNIKYTSSAWEISQIKLSDIQFNKVYTNLDEFNKAPAGTYPILKLNNNENSVTISREDGILDLNGHSVATLFLTNKAGTLIVRNGTVGTIDDTGGESTSFRGNVILSNVRATTVYAGSRTFYYVGTTSVIDFRRENGGYSSQGEYDSNRIANPIAQTGLVYNGEKQLLIDTTAMRGLYGCNLSNGYFTYFYNRTGQNSLYVKGTTANGVIDTNCDPIYATEAGTYTLYYMWDINDDFLDVNYGSFTVTIAKADPEYTIPENLDIKTGSKLSDIELPSGWSWADSETPVGEPGTKTFTATFTPNDTTNYNIIENIDVPVTVKDYVDLEFTDMADGIDYAVAGDESYAYITDGATIYSNQTIAGDISKVQLNENTQTDGYTYNEKTYKYKYDVTFSQELESGSTVTLKHVHEYGNPHVEIRRKPDIIIADCTGEKGESVGTIEIAQLQPKEIYHYGDLPTVNDVVIVPEQMPNGITSITPKTLSIRYSEKTTTQETFTTFGTYELSAVVDVVYNGKTVPCTITKNVQYEPRSLFGEANSSSADEEYTGCYFYLRRYEETEEPQEENPAPVEQQEEEPAAEQGSAPEIQEENPPAEAQGPVAEEQGEPAEQQELQYEDTLLTVNNGVITLPEDSFVYNKREQKPVIVVKNSINGTVTELTEEEITSTVEGKTGANKDNEYYEFNISAVPSEDEENNPANYSGEVTVKWRIEKAPNQVTFAAKTDTVYDAEALDDTDFTFTDPDDTLNDTNIDITVEGKVSVNEGGTVGGTGDTRYDLTSNDSMKKLTKADIFNRYYLPTDYSYTLTSKKLVDGEVSTTNRDYDLSDIQSVYVISGSMKWYLVDDTSSIITTITETRDVYDVVTVIFDEQNKTAEITFTNEATYAKMLEDAREEYDITSAGVQKGTITIKSDNYQDKVMDFETTIAKKEVTVAPNGIKDNDTNTITWGELIKDSDVLYSQDGVVDKDKPSGGDYNFGLIFTAEGYNFNDASQNDVGEYKLVPSDIFAEYNAADNNYLLVLPKEETEEEIEPVEEVIPVEEFTPLELSEVAEQEEQSEQEEQPEQEEQTEQEEVKLDTLTIVPYELTSSNVTVADITYQYDTYVKTPTVTATVPYSVKDDDELQTYTLSLGTVEDHDSKDAFVKGVRYDNIVGEKNISVATDNTTNKNFTAGENGVEFKWYINKGTLSVSVDNIPNKFYDGTTVTAPTVTVKNQIDELVPDYETKIQYQKKDEETEEYSDPVDEAPKDAGTYRAVVTINADSYEEKVSYSEDFKIFKRIVIVTLSDLPTVKGYNDKTVGYKISVADAENPNDFTGIIDNEVEPEGNVVIEAGKENGDHITNDDLPEIVEALGDNYTFEYDEVLTLAEPKLARLEVRKAYMDEGEVIKPHDYITAYDENGRDITDKCVVINIDNINQTGDYKIEVNDGSLDVPLSDILYVLTKVDEVNDLIAELPESDDVTAEDEEAITKAREAYEALTDEQKEKVDEDALNKLEDAEQALEDAQKAAEATEAINALPAAEDVTTEDAEDIENAREKYDALTDAQKELVDEETVDKLEAAEDALEKVVADQEAADAVKQEINDLPAAEDVTTEDSKNIEKARADYDALTDAQKALVDEETVDKLEAVEDALEKVVADQAAADAVKQAINALPAAENVTAADNDAIVKAREDYNGLTIEQKELVDEDTVEKLDAAENALAKAIDTAQQAAADEAAANAVRESINALPETEAVKPEDAENIAKARDDYNALTAAQKELVDDATLQKLVAAEDALEKANEAAKKAAEDEAAADAVKQAIKALPASEEVTIEDAAKLAEVRDAFEGLTDDQKGLVDGDTMSKLDNDEQAVADIVKNAIGLLPDAENVTKDDVEAIASARKMYDQLSDKQKSMIDADKVEKLTADEEAAAAALEPKYMKGDVNGDGKVNINDLTKVAAHVKGKKILSEEEQLRADVNGDGKININDITQLAAHIKGKRLLK